MRILLIDDHPLILTVNLDLLKSLFPDAEVSTCSVFAEVLALEHKNHEVIISDLMMPDVEPEEVVQCLERDFPRSKLIFLSAIEATSDFAMRISAKGHVYICKSMSFKEIVSMLHNSVGLRLPTIDMQAANEHRSLIQIPGSKPLTKRQVQIMDLLIEGQTAKEIARSIEMSPDTVKAHIKEIYLRLNASSRAEAVASYIQARKMAVQIHGELSI